MSRSELENKLQQLMSEYSHIDERNDNEKMKNIIKLKFMHWQKEYKDPAEFINHASAFLTRAITFGGRALELAKEAIDELRKKSGVE